MGINTPLSPGLSTTQTNLYALGLHPFLSRRFPKTSNPEQQYDLFVPLALRLGEDPPTARRTRTTVTIRSVLPQVPGERRLAPTRTPPL